ncbi:MAG: protein-tyrosine-phosphatase [Acidimicrobiia bacterium]|nr:protein-tyrosine-phosphatase [Acidimicrobiia bacterium]
MLVVCTGNICRSPMGEVLLRARLEARGASANVHSAGTMAWDVTPPPEAVAVMEEMGLDISSHRSRPLTVDLIEHADVVLGMTRNHVGRVVALVPDAAVRAFLVGELVRLGELVGERAGGETVAAWARRVGATRPDVRVPGRGDDEVADPYGESLAFYRATATRLDADLRRVAALLVT